MFDMQDGTYNEIKTMSFSGSKNDRFLASKRQATLELFVMLVRGLVFSRILFRQLDVFSCISHLQNQ